jgi:hypothetical protein
MKVFAIKDMIKTRVKDLLESFFNPNPIQSTTYMKEYIVNELFLIIKTLME